MNAAAVSASLIPIFAANSAFCLSSASAVCSAVMPFGFVGFHLLHHFPEQRDVSAKKVGVCFGIAMAGNDYVGRKRSKLFQSPEPLRRICAADGEWIRAEQNVAGDENFFLRQIEISIARW